MSDKCTNKHVRFCFVLCLFHENIKGVITRKAKTHACFHSAKFKRSYIKDSRRLKYQPESKTWGFTKIMEPLAYIKFIYFGNDEQFLYKPGPSGRVVYSAVLAACSIDVHGFDPQTSTNACWYVCKYIGQKGFAAMLTSIQSAGVAPEVNLRNPLCAGEEARKQGIYPGFETQGRHLQKSQTGVSVATRKGLMSSKFF